MADVIWYIGFFHLALYTTAGFAFVAFSVFRLIGRIGKLIWQHRNDLLPRYEQ